MSRWYEDKFEEDFDFLDDVRFSDESHHWVCGHVNSNNCLYWGAEDLDEVLQKPLLSVKISAKVAI